MVPHRTAGGAVVEKAGLNAAEILEAKIQTLILMGVEPRYEQINSARARQQIKDATTIIISTHLSKHAVDHADVVLPSAAFAETAGTFVNATGAWQMFNGATAPPGQGRPAWKILRVLGNELELEGFGYNDVTEIREELKSLCRDIQLSNDYTLDNIEIPDAVNAGQSLLRIGDLPAYKSDMLVRRARSLQKTQDAQQNHVTLNSADMQKLGVDEGAVVTLEQHDATVMVSVKQDDGVPAGCAWLPIGSIELAGFGSLFEPVKLVPGG
jgi:NADH-quinone oxidoreductase subunit G